MQKKIGNVIRGKWLARKGRIARRLKKTDRIRLTVFRSARHIYAQLDDPESGRTLGSVSTRSNGLLDSESQTGTVEAAKKVGQAIAVLAKEKDIQEVVFNRNGFLYHGRVKALAEAAREAGLKF